MAKLHVPRLSLRSRRSVHDLLFLAFIVTFSVAPYVTQLGFYSDDWTYLGVLLNSSDQSFTGLFKAQYAFTAYLRQRPTQIALQAVLFRSFGLDPLGYHLVNAAILASVALLVYGILRELETHRAISLAVPAVYILLPNYSTDRFWFAAFGYGLSAAFFFAGTYAFLRCARAQRVWSWAVFGLLALAVAALGMEVVMPLTVVLPLGLWWCSKRLPPGGLAAKLGMRQTLLLLCSPFAVIAAVILYKAGTAVGSSVPDVRYLAQLAIGSLTVNFGTYGVGLPHTTAWGLRQLPFSSAALGAILGAIVFAFLSRTDPPPASRRIWTGVCVVGAVVFILGTAIFLVSGRIGFSSTGISNRVWIAAALGVALVLVGTSGWVSSRLSPATRQQVFAGLVASCCLSAFIINTALSKFWVAAWPQEREVLRGIQQALPTLPPGTTLILDGVCPYLGPAIVFEASWDSRGALWVIYRDPTLRADVTTGRFAIEPGGLRTQIYGTSFVYPYGNALLRYDHRSRSVLRLTDADVARKHVRGRAECPWEREGWGTVTLPFDAAFLNLEQKLALRYTKP